MTRTSREADVGFIESLALLLRENDLTELEVTREEGEGVRLDVRISRAAPAMQIAPAAQAPASVTQPATAQPAPAGSPGHAPAPPEDPAEHPGAVISPMVGTAYMRPEPGADPFVSVGDPVDEGQTLMIVEAMKTMNHIPAPFAGTVRRILVDEGIPVEYGAPLMIIEPA